MMVSLQYEDEGKQLIIWGLYYTTGLEHHGFKNYLCLGPYVLERMIVMPLTFADRSSEWKRFVHKLPKHDTVVQNDLFIVDQRNTHELPNFKTLQEARQVYLHEADAATVAFLILTTVRKEVPILKDVARIIAKMVYTSYEDTVWTNAAPCII